METESGFVRFRLPVSWDIAMRVLKHTARNGQTRFDIERHGNGFLRLRRSRSIRSTITIDVMSLAEQDSVTTVLVVDVTRGLRLAKRDNQQVISLLERFRSDAEFFATHLSTLDRGDTVMDERQPGASASRVAPAAETSFDWWISGRAADAATEAT